MAGVFWYDGVWMTEEPKILGPMDHAFWLGSVIFDGARALRGFAPDLDLHCQRCIRSALALHMQPSKTAAEIEALCREGIRRMGPTAELYVRPMFFIRRGLGAEPRHNTAQRHARQVTGRDAELVDEGEDSATEASSG